MKEWSAWGRSWGGGELVAVRGPGGHQCAWISGRCLGLWASWLLERDRDHSGPYPVWASDSWPQRQVVPPPSPDICSSCSLVRNIPDDKKVSQERQGGRWPGDGLQFSGQLAHS